MKGFTVPKGGLTGSRIRARRLDQGQKQADLARSVGISPAYLNLIEHNRRRIGGKLLNDLARALGADAATLSAGAESALLGALRDAATGPAPGTAELDRVEEFAGRFPGWAALLVAQAERIGRLEHTAQTLTDRLTHDPFLSASMHEVLSTVTAIRSTAAILRDTPDIDPGWRDRFHRNLHQESVRLADGAGELVSYLDRVGDSEAALSAPQDELDAALAARGYHFEELEAGGSGAIDTLVAGLEGLSTAPARALAAACFARYAEDAHALPLAGFTAAATEAQYDPARLAARFGTTPARAMRRLATLPASPGAAQIGLVSCDGSGTFTFRKPLAGFVLPRFGAACPYWPLYQALVRPMAPIRAVVELADRTPRRFLTYAICETAGPASFDMPQLVEATMLILSGPEADLADARAQPVGSSCRICPRNGCAARREPSILAHADQR